jgi:DinB family protein
MRKTLMMISTLLAFILPLRAADTPLACNLGALTPAQRKEHAALTLKVMAAATKKDATSNGHVFHLDQGRVSVAEVGRWIALESRCCPFFDFQLTLARDEGPLVLQLSGGKGVREFMAAELGVPAGQPAGATVLDVWVTRVEELVVPAADAMPEERYGFVPTSGNFNGVRTFAGQVKHLAAANHQLAAKAIGEKPPAGTQNETAPESIRTKAEIMRYLKDSFAALHRAADSSESAERESFVIDALVHSSNHYGQVIEYLRMNGIVPPASR